MVIPQINGMTIFVNGYYFQVWTDVYIDFKDFYTSCYFKYPHRNNIPLNFNAVDSSSIFRKKKNK